MIRDRSLGNFDFTFDPKLNRSLVFDLAIGGFVAKDEDALFLGPGAQVRAISRGHRTSCNLAGLSLRYRKAHVLLDDLADAAAAGARKQFMTTLAAMLLLIIDDFGMRALRLLAFAHRSAAWLAAGVSEVSRFSRMKFSTVLGPTTTQDRRWTRVHAHLRVAFRYTDDVGTLITDFRSSVPSPPVPLFTLRPPPRDGARKTRGQDGSLLLSCAALSSATSCRFYPGAPVSSAQAAPV